MKTIILIICIPLSNLFAQDTVYFNLEKDFKLADTEYIQLKDSCENHFNNIIVQDSIVHSIYLKYDKTIIRIRSIDDEGFQYGLMITKLYKDINNYKELSDKIEDLQFNLMVSKQWRDKMEFVPPKKYEDLDITAISYVMERKFEDVVKFINNITNN